MELYPLQVFLTIAAEKSFSRAAERLLRTQPAVSLALQRLETELGEKLIDRSAKELVLTDTIEYRFEPLPPCCKIISVANLFADAIISIHRRESVSRLFNY